MKSFSNKAALKSLAINSCNLNGALLTELKNSIQDHTKLKELYLFANKISKESAVDISAILRNKQGLTCLGLSNNKIFVDGAREIAKNGLFGKTQVVKLSIENN